MGKSVSLYIVLLKVPVFQNLLTILSEELLIWYYRSPGHEYSWPLNKARVRGADPGQLKILLSLKLALRIQAPWFIDSADVKSMDMVGWLHIYFKKFARKWDLHFKPCCSRVSCRYIFPCLLLWSPVGTWSRLSMRNSSKMWNKVPRY